ncbi:hypothetical protein HanRHA438_Chr10g0467871 [Helianthus annuus]|nr:hypothetical protein HanRHA438_Chr10g0467871 [Helianthus annuus]
MSIVMQLVVKSSSVTHDRSRSSSFLEISLVCRIQHFIYLIILSCLCLPLPLRLSDGYYYLFIILYTF